MGDLRVERTADGSLTVLNTVLGSTYHSRHGARAESRHVFIEAGLLHRLSTLQADEIRILEMGLGTGLNCLMTAEALAGRCIHATYDAVETMPLPDAVVEALCADSPMDSTHLLHQLHRGSWGMRHALTPEVAVTKHLGRLQDFAPSAPYDLIYYDAFEPLAQPELWSEEIFGMLYGMTAPGGILVTYCAKGSVRRAMQAAGYSVDRLPGPPFKREMLRAHVMCSAD